MVFSIPCRSRPKPQHARERRDYATSRRTEAGAHRVLISPPRHFFASLGGILQRSPGSRMGKALRRPILAAGFALAMVPIARADDAADCDQQYDPNLAISACTRYLATPVAASE